MRAALKQLNAPVSELRLKYRATSRTFKPAVVVSVSADGTSCSLQFQSFDDVTEAVPLHADAKRVQKLPGTTATPTEAPRPRPSSADRKLVRLLLGEAVIVRTAILNLEHVPALTLAIEAQAHLTNHRYNMNGIVHSLEEANRFGMVNRYVGLPLDKMVRDVSAANAFLDQVSPHSESRSQEWDAELRDIGMGKLPCP